MINKIDKTMKKKYMTPVLDVVEFTVSNIIATSETVGVGNDVESGRIESPHRNAIWDE